MTHFVASQKAHRSASVNLRLSFAPKVEVFLEIRLTNSPAQLNLVQRHSGYFARGPPADHLQRPLAREATCRVEKNIN